MPVIECILNGYSYPRYFLNIHPIFPIVNKHTFLERYRGLSKSYPSTIVFNAMLGAAARYFEISNDESLLISTNGRALSDILFDRVLKEVFLQSVSGPSLPMVQAIILLLNHHARMDSKGSNCYLLIGIVSSKSITRRSVYQLLNSLLHSL